MLTNILFGVAAATMILGPITVAVVAGRKRGWTVRWLGIGAVTFIASQVVHLPLNWALGQLGWMTSTSPIEPTTALVAGLTAGLCEESARWLVLSFWLDEVRDHNRATAYGIGHGGVEATLLGVLAAFSLINMISLQTMDLTALGLEPDALTAVKAQVLAFSEQPAWHAVLGPFERVMAMINHVFLTVLVLRSITRKQPLWLVAAIGWHALFNAVGVWVFSHYGAVAAEAAIGVSTVLAAAGWWQARRWFNAEAGTQG